MSPVKDRSPDIGKYPPLSIGPPVEVHPSQQPPPSYPAYNNSSDNMDPNRTSSSSLQVATSGTSISSVSDVLLLWLPFLQWIIITAQILIRQVIIHLLLLSDYPLRFLTFHMTLHHILLLVICSITWARVIHILTHHKSLVTKSKSCYHNCCHHYYTL